ncbi:MAG: alpha/beta hydrolase [Candidatus Latescibacterota bacterium]
MAEVRSKGVRIDYLDVGSGSQTLLLLPAWCMSRSIYRDLIPLLARSCRVLAMDWRGHGASERPAADFGAADFVDDCLAVIEASGARQAIPVSASHAGWVSISMRHRLGAQRVPRLVFIDWLVLPPPPGFVELVHGLSTPEGWQRTRDTLFDIWLEGVTDERAIRFVREEMASYDGEMWMRSGREIGGCYQRFGGYPLAYLATLDPPAPSLHVYAQPRDQAYYEGQAGFAARNPWYEFVRLEAHGHFAVLGSAPQIADAIQTFITAPRAVGDPAVAAVAGGPAATAR